MITVVAAVVGLVVGFAIGRVKNAAKLAAVKAEVARMETYASLDVQKFLARIKAKF